MHEQVQEYYGEVLQGSDDLQTNACCTDDSMPRFVKNALAKVHDEVMARYYGCGLVAPEQLKGCAILDLGSGSGRDCYVLSQFVGESGRVVGVDMTDAQLEVANRHLAYHQDAFGYTTGNVEFRKGYIEKLDELDLPDNSFDVIVSNCVINLSPDKEAVFREAYRLLKPGGELYFSDVYADRRVPTSLKSDPELYGECLSGALYWNDFLRLAKKAGFADPRLVEDRPITIDNERIEQKIGHIGFYSATYRLFKIAELEDACEDYGQVAMYQGSIKESPHQFILDNHHVFQTGKPMLVCANTAAMIQSTRLAQYFEVQGDLSVHYGLFEDCGETSKSKDLTQPPGGCC